MSEHLKALYELQQIDTSLAKSMKARASLDAGASMKRQLAVIRQEHEDADKSLHEANTEMRDCDLNLKTIESKSKSYNDKLYAGKVTNAKELSSMEQEIAMLGRQKDKLEERILELMDVIEARKAVLAIAQASLAKHEEEYAAYMTGQRRKAAVLDAKIKQLAALREDSAPKVDKALLARYESMRGRLGGIGVSKVDEGTCSVCHTQLLKNIMGALVSDEDIQTCENCSRILYLEIK